MNLSDQQTQLLFTSITRFGTVLFIIYIVSVLLNVFRYLMRLSAYHEARAHALQLVLELGDANTKCFADYAAVLSAEKIEFGKAPKTPVENVAELLKDLAEVGKNFSGKNSKDKEEKGG